MIRTNFGVFCFLEKPVLRFALLPYYCRTLVLHPEYPFVINNGSSRCCKYTCVFRQIVKIRFSLLNRLRPLTNTIDVITLTGRAYQQMTPERNLCKQDHSGSSYNFGNYLACWLKVVIGLRQPVQFIRVYMPENHTNYLVLVPLSPETHCPP